MLRRDKTRLLFAEALHLAAPDVEGGDAAARAVQVENAIFAQNGNINQRYKAKVRSLSFNLKDPKNPDLRRRVLSGALTGECERNRWPDSRIYDACVLLDSLLAPAHLG